MSMKRLLWLSIALLVSCGDPTAPSAGAPNSPTAGSSTTSSPGGETLYEGTGMVLQKGDAPPELCLGAVMDSLPPQCGGPVIIGWDWDLIGDEETAADVTWGDATVLGHFDGDSFEVVEAGAPEWPEDDEDPIGTACPEPSGGWASPDPDKMTEDHRERVMRSARREPDFAGLWIDYLEEPAEFEDTPYVLNVAFTGDLERHEADIRKDWGGPLCVTEFDHTLDELTKIQNELSGSVGKDLGLDVLTAGSYEYENTVEISVVVVTEEQLAEIAKRYGPGVVEVDARLRPAS